MFVLYLLVLEFLLLKCFHQSCLQGYSETMNRCVRFALECEVCTEMSLRLSGFYLFDGCVSIIVIQ